MDQQKIGSFLKELRKGKALTQEQLAEHFGVSVRTVSRWENGNNMPDLSILVELADFYDVDIREIIDGERKSENMNQEEKEKLRMVADYAENEKAVLLKRLRVFSIVGLFAMLAEAVLLMLQGDASLPVTEYISGVLFGVAFAALLTAVFYSTGILASLRKAKATSRCMKVIAVISIVMCIVLLALSIAASI